jgi:hypothetical protein
MNATATPTLTPASHALFIAYAMDAGNWGGTPLVGGNVGGSKADAGNLTDLKQKGLLETFDDAGDAFVLFTDAGKEYAAAHGVNVDC